MTIVLLLLAIGAGLAFWAGWWEPRRVRIRRFTFTMRNLNAPLKLVAIGDIQPNQYHWSSKRLESLFERTARDEAPDLVVWLGDYYNAPTDKFKEYLDDQTAIRDWIASQLPSMSSIAAAMAKLPGRLGSVAILGNHDWAWSGSETKAQIEAHGIGVLKDEVVQFTCPKSGGTIQVAGLEDISSGRIPSYHNVNTALSGNAATIVLSHSPDAFASNEWRGDLMLSGHTHGGQVRLPFLGALVLPIENREYDWGWFERAGRHMYVTSGLGTSLPPLRFLCPPEIVVIDLQPMQES